MVLNSLLRMQTMTLTKMKIVPDFTRAVGGTRHAIMPISTVYTTAKVMAREYTGSISWVIRIP